MHTSVIQVERLKRKCRQMMALSAVFAVGMTASAYARTVQEALNSLYPGWTVSNLHSSITSNDDDVIHTHPAGDKYSGSKPATLTYQGSIPGSNPVLHLKVSSNMTKGQLYDWVFKMRINGQPVGDAIIIKSSTPVDIKFPLAAWANQGNVKIELENAPGGKELYTAEHAYWHLIEISDVELYTLNKDEDWTGRAEAFPAMVDLNGHNLTVAQFPDVCTLITDSSTAGAGGELRVNVESGEIGNADVMLAGSLRLVKTGSGTFTATKMIQTYTGGTDVREGQFKLQTGSWGTETSLGALNTTMVVAKGATLELNGNDRVFCVHPLVLAGGTLQNTGPSNVENPARIGNVRLTADSVANVKTCINITGLIDLGGFTLDEECASGQRFTFEDGASFTNGCVKVSPSAGAGWVYFNGAAKDMRTVDFVCKGTLGIVSDISVRNWTFTYTSTHGLGAGKIDIYGVYVPKTKFFWNCIMQDGSILDLSGERTVWNSTGKRLSFADNATIMIVPPKVSSPKHDIGIKIVSWTTAPANIDTITFKLAPGYDGAVLKSDDGLYLVSGMVLILR